MRRFSTITFLLIAALAILALAGCGPFAIVTPTPRPTGVLPTLAPTQAPGQVTAQPTAGETAQPTATTAPGETPAATDTPGAVEPTPTATATGVAPTATSTGVPPTATATSVPPTATPTSVPPTATPTRLPPTATPTRVPPTSTPVTITDWKGEYYDNVSLQGSPRVVRNDRVVDFNLPKGTAPATNMPSENWSARWSRVWRFDEGNYRFHVLVDDGARLWVGDRLLIDAWVDGGAREYTAELYLRGDVALRLEYYNRLGDARARLNWEPVTQYTGWQGSYYAVRDLTGLPVFQRGDANIDFDWGNGSPRADLPADNFSVRWAQTINFAAGLYRFSAFSDDGVRVYVDDRLVIDAWRDGQAGHQGDIQLTAGQHRVRVDYYEHTGSAAIKVSWTQIGAPTATPTATGVPPTATPTSTGVPPTATPTATGAPPTAVPPTATPTRLPPTVPPTQPPVPPPARPAIRAEPAVGPIDRPFDVIGTGWPANITVELFLARPGDSTGPQQPIAQAVADGAGNWRVQIAVPPGQGWEGQEIVRIQARAVGQPILAGATYRVEPGLQPVSFTALPVGAARPIAPGPAYLAIGSAQTWAQWFEGEGPRVDPAVDWRREVVIAVLAGTQPGSGTSGQQEGSGSGAAQGGPRLGVQSIVQRGNLAVVTVGPVPVDPNNPNVNRALVRVAREQLRPRGQEQLQFLFYDAGGRRLAEGPADAVAMASDEAVAAALKAPGPESSRLGVGGGLTETVAAAAVTETLGAAAASEAATETLGAAAASDVPAEQAQAAEELAAADTESGEEAAAQATPLVDAGATLPGRSVLTWVLIGLGVVALAGVGVYIARRRV